MDQSGPEQWLTQHRTGGSAAPEYSGEQKSVLFRSVTFYECVTSSLLKKLFECKEKITFSPGRSVEVFHDAEMYTFLHPQTP